MNERMQEVEQHSRGAARAHERSAGDLTEKNPLTGKELELMNLMMSLASW